MSLLCLIGEDNPPVTHHLRSYAEMCGFQVVHATDGERVLDIARGTQLGFILLNTALPGKVRGWEVLRLLKSDDLTRRIPVVTYCLGEEGGLRDEAEGADAWFRMPVLYTGFRRILARAGVGPFRTAAGDADPPARRCCEQKPEDDG